MSSGPILSLSMPTELKMYGYIGIFNNIIIRSDEREVVNHHFQHEAFSLAPFHL